MAEQTSDEFWRLFAVYIRKLSTRPDSSASLLEGCVLPLLDRLNFLMDCHDLCALESILDSLRASGYQLPLHTRKALSAELFFKVLKPDHSITSAPACKARQLTDFAKRTLGGSFHSLREAMEAAQTKLQSCKETDGVHLQTKLCLLEEEVCWSICDENRLLQYVLEDEGQISCSYGGDNAERSLTDEGSRLAGFIRRGLQSQRTDARRQTLRLAVACSFHSHFVFSKFLPLFQTSLYLEDFSFRKDVLAALMDLIYMHHGKLTLSAIAHLIFPFLYAPTGGLQLIAVIGCGRLLLFDCFPEETECLLSAMIERYVYDPNSNVAGSASIKDLQLEAVGKAMHCFFQEYSGGKKLHQDEIANTLVYLCLEKLEDGVVLILQGGNQQVASMRDNPERAEEARRLHLALHFGLSISDSTLDAVLDSLVLNINEQRASVDPHVLNMLTRNACRNWLLCSS